LNLFISKFLTLIHEEGNKYLPIRVAQQQHQLISTNKVTQDENESPMHTPKNDLQSQLILDNSIRSCDTVPNSIYGTPVGSFQRKVNLQPLMQSSGTRGFL
jgi:hypothetical protein